MEMNKQMATFQFRVFHELHGIRWYVPQPALQLYLRILSPTQQHAVLLGRYPICTGSRDIMQNFTIWFGVTNVHINHNFSIRKSHPSKRSSTLHVIDLEKSSSIRHFTTPMACTTETRRYHSEAHSHHSVRNEVFF